MADPVKPPAPRSLPPQSSNIIKKFLQFAKEVLKWSAKPFTREETKPQIKSGNLAEDPPQLPRSDTVLNAYAQKDSKGEQTKPQPGESLTVGNRTEEKSNRKPAEF